MRQPTATGKLSNSNHGAGGIVRLKKPLLKINITKKRINQNFFHVLKAHVCISVEIKVLFNFIVSMRRLQNHKNSCSKWQNAAPL